jgi:hypothetical protein
MWADWSANWTADLTAAYWVDRRVDKRAVPWGQRSAAQLAAKKDGNLAARMAASKAVATVVS